MTTATCAADEPGLPAAHKQDNALAADAATADIPGTLHAHERVLMHGQPGFGADWHQSCRPRCTLSLLTGRIRLQSASRCGAPSWRSNVPCCANWTSWCSPSHPSRPVQHLPRRAQDVIANAIVAFVAAAVAAGSQATTRLQTAKRPAHR